MIEAAEAQPHHEQNRASDGQDDIGHGLAFADGGVPAAGTLYKE
jgi:hypothetical protein